MTSRIISYELTFLLMALRQTGLLMPFEIAIVLTYHFRESLFQLLDARVSMTTPTPRASPFGLVAIVVQKLSLLLASQCRSPQRHLVLPPVEGSTGQLRLAVLQSFRVATIDVPAHLSDQLVHRLLSFLTLCVALFAREVTSAVPCAQWFCRPLPAAPCMSRPNR